MEGIEDAFDGVWNDLSDAAVEEYAQQVAEVAREEGLASADRIEIAVDDETAASRLQIDVDAVRRRANEILAGD